MVFGGINFGGKLGSYTITNHSTARLPQALATAVSKLESNELTGVGATYKAVWYLGAQVVNGKNYALVCEKTTSDKDATEEIVVVIINIPPQGAVTGEGAKVVEIIDKNNATFDENLLANFKKAVAKLTGVGYIPILYFGTQVVKGINYFIIAQAKVENPYAVMVTMNVFEGDAKFVDIKPLR